MDQDWFIEQALHRRQLDRAGAWACNVPDSYQNGWAWNNDFRQNQAYIGDQGQWQNADWQMLQGQRFRDQMRGAGYNGYGTYYDHVPTPWSLQLERRWDL
jgi:hypothetical protein